MSRHSTVVAIVAAGLSVAVSMTLVGCDAATPMPVPTSTASSSPSPSASTHPPREPKLLPGGTALANHDYFDFVNERLFATTPDADGRMIIDNLVAAGFDKAAMQVTADKTSQLRRPVDSIQFSVLIGPDCLVGQFGNSGYYSIIGPVLSAGTCLIGKTRPIDW